MQVELVHCHHGVPRDQMSLCIGHSSFLGLPLETTTHQGHKRRGEVWSFKCGWWRSMELCGVTLTHLLDVSSHTKHVQVSQVARRFRKHHHRTSPTKGFPENCRWKKWTPPYFSWHAHDFCGLNPHVSCLENSREWWAPTPSPICWVPLIASKIHVGWVQSPFLLISPSLGMKFPRIPYIWQWNPPKSPKFSKIHPNFAMNSPKKNNIRAHFQISLAAWLPAETAEAPVDQLLPSLCKSWANLGRFQQFRSLR